MCYRNSNVKFSKPFDGIFIVLGTEVVSFEFINPYRSLVFLLENNNPIGPFEKHIVDAIAVNKQRMPLYADLTGRGSIKLSKGFIRGQKLSLFFVRKTDRIAKFWIESGVPIVEMDMVDMDEIPAFQNHLDFRPQSLSEFKVLQVKALKFRLRKGFYEKGFNGVKVQAEKELAVLKRDSTFHAMAKHMLESLIRTCNMAPIYDKMALHKGIPGTYELSKKMLGHHLIALNGCRRIDKLAAPFQARGVPIIHQDVPYISPFAQGFNEFTEDNLTEI